MQDTKSSEVGRFVNTFISPIGIPQKIDLTDWTETEQVNALFCQLQFLLGFYPGSPVCQKKLPILNTFKLNLPNYPTIITNYKKFTERLKTLQSWNEFFKILNISGTATVIGVGVLGFILGSGLLIAMGATPLAIVGGAVGIALSAGAVYGLFVALPQFIYNHYIKPGQINAALEILSGKEQLVSEVNRVQHTLYPQDNSPNLEPYRDSDFSPPPFSKAPPAPTIEPTPEPQPEAGKNQGPKKT